jgi:hypothetical protein
MSLFTLVSLWLPLLLGFYYVRNVRNVEGTGLVTAYLVSFCGLHWAAGLIRLLPWFRDRSLVFTTYGLEQSTCGLAAFVVGSLFLSPVLVSCLPICRSAVRYIPDPQLPKTYLFIGALSYLLLLTFLSRLPSMSVVISSGQGLYVAGLCLFCWNAIRRELPGALMTGLVLALMMPLITIITQGFMGYGAAAALILFAFVGSFFSRRKMLVLALLACYIGLSVYVTYMRDRRDIRTVVWGGQPLQDRLDQIGRTFDTFEWFDPYNSAHLNRIDARMNQDFLVGAAVARLSDRHDFADGETVWGALLALVPRALWPEKPVFAGSGDLVAHYTGFHFAEGTSVGVGQVLEFYINFGTVGVVLGFLILGAIFTTVDVVARRLLLAGDQQGFVLWFIAGMAMLRPGGSLVELSAGTAGGLITVGIINRYLLPHLQKKHFAPTVPIRLAPGSRSDMPAALPSFSPAWRRARK